MRHHNLALVLGLLVDEGPRSRASLATASGLTKATVSALVRDLEERGLVHETEMVQGAAGRPATLVSVSDRRVVGLALTIDVDHLAVGAVDLAGALHHLDVVPIDNRSVRPATVINRAVALVERLQRAVAAAGREPVGLTVAVPGLTADGDVLVAPNLGWQEVPLAGPLGRSLDRGAGARAGAGPGVGRIVLENEANLAARAEARTRPERTFIHVSAGVGVGAGVVIDGELQRGAHGFGGELGHFVVDPGGAPCRCGNHGCLETVAGTDAILAAAARSTTTARGGGTARRSARGGGADRDRDADGIEALAAHAAAGDTRSLAVLETVASALADALAGAVSLVDPDAVVLGGSLTRLTPWLAPTVRTQLERRVLGSRWVSYPVLASNLGQLGPLTGGGWAALQPVRDDPLTVAPLATRA